VIFSICCPKSKSLGRNPIVSQRRKLWFFGGTTEIMKEIIGRGLGL